MRTFLFAGTLAVTFAAAGSARAADATPTGIEVGLRSGFALPLGDLQGGSGLGGTSTKLSDAFNGFIPIWVDAGYRLNPNIYIGAFFQYGIGLVNNSGSTAGQVSCTTSGVSCTGNNLLFGVDAHYHLMPEGTFDPYGGLGVGYEILSANVSAGGNSGGVSYNGFQFVNFQVGADYKAMPNLGIGPFVMFSLGQFSGCSFSGSASSLGNCTIPQQAMHEYLTFGLRGAYDINL
jgi:opacity protein-like surface antigen